MEYALSQGKFVVIHQDAIFVICPRAISHSCYASSQLYHNETYLKPFNKLWTVIRANAPVNAICNIKEQLNIVVFMLLLESANLGLTNLLYVC